MTKHFYSSVLLCISGLTASAQFGQPERISPISVHVVSTGIGDMDGDGDMDIVVSSRADGRIVWHENNGEGRFNNHHIIVETSPKFRHILVEDLDQNGRADIVVGKNQYGNHFNALLMNYPSGFVQSVLPNSDDYPYVKHLFAVDMDNDDHKDILLAYASGNIVTWFRNLGGGAFSEAIEVLLPEGRKFHFLGDVNGDSLPDMLFAGESVGSGSSSNYNFYRLINDSAGVLFHVDSVPIPNIYAITGVGDINNDGLIDILAERRTSSNQAVGWLANDGNGGYSNFLTLVPPLHDHPKAFIVDIDQNGSNEVIVTKGGLLMYELIGISSQTIDTLSRMYPGFQALADFNGDGLLDVYSELNVVFNNGSLQFWDEMEVVNNLTGCRDIDLVDMNKDGFVDIVGTSHNGGGSSLQVLHYLGQGQYASKAELVDYGKVITNVMPRDFDGDGLLDLGYTGWYHGKFHVALNDFQNGFGPPELLFDSGINSGGWASICEDFDNDGDLDAIMVPSGYNNNHITLHRNEGNGVFTQENITLNTFGSTPGMMTAFDLEGDGDLDVALVAHDDVGGIAVFINDGTGSFEVEFLDDYTDWYSTKVSAADFDGDGDMDLVFNLHILPYDVMMPATGIVVVYEYDDGEFIRHLIDQTTVYYPYISHTMDVDKDGLVDILCFAMNAGPTLDNGGFYWYKNLGNMEFSSAYFSHITALNINQPYDMESIDRDHDGDLDIILSEMGNGWISGGVFYFENHFWGSYRLQGHGFYDADNSGTLTAPDVPFPMLSVQVSPAQSAFFTNAEGEYNALCGVGTYTVSPVVDTQLWSLSTPSSYTADISDAQPLAAGLDFGVIPNGVQPAAELIFVEPMSPCNVAGMMWASVRNTGNTILTGTLTVTIDTLLTYFSATPAPVSVQPGQLTFQLDSLFFNESAIWSIEVHMPDHTALGIPMTNTASYTDISGIEATDLVQNPLLCAYDPNDKHEHTGIGPEGYISDGQWLYYTVRFQNTGNAPATDVTIRDPLSPHLDRATLTPLAWSFTPEVSVEPDGDAVFRFKEIMLPDSGSDFAGSQGFIRYKVKAKGNQFPGTETENTAHIFFDFNPPITTNTTLNTMECYEPEGLVITYTQPKLRSPFKHPVSQQWYLNDTLIPGATGPTLIPEVDGQYHVKAIYPTECKLESPIFNLIGLAVNEQEVVSAVFRPNPFHESTSIKISPAPTVPFHICVTDLAGREVLRRQQVPSDHVTILSSELRSGFFLVYMEQGAVRSFLGKLVRR